MSAQGAWVRMLYIVCGCGLLLACALACCALLAIVLAYAQ